MRGNRAYLLKLGLVVIDICSVVIAAYGALWLRFDLSLSSIPEYYIQAAESAIVASILATIGVYIIFHLYSSLWTYAGANELINIIAAGVIAGFANCMLVMLQNGDVSNPLPRSYYPLYTIMLVGLAFASRYGYRFARMVFRNRIRQELKKRVLIIGAGRAGNELIREIHNSDFLHMKVVGVIDDDPAKLGSYIHGIKVIGNSQSIIRYAKELVVEEIIVAIPSASVSQMKSILDICKETGCTLKRLPGIYQLVNGEVSVRKLKDVDVNDLLAREPIQVDLKSIMGYVSGKVVLVTGGGGSIGSELCRQIAAYSPKKLILVDIYENNAYDLQNELRRKFPYLNLVVLIASVRNQERMESIFRTYKPDIVYHAAAHKHVPLMEDSPNEAVKNNVLGTWNVVKAASKYKVKRFVMVSTDKAVNPTNIMGATKRICEMIIQTYDRHSETEFVAVRFGNVLGSNGSVIPLFKKQIEEGGPVTVTHPDIIRYFMTIPEAVSLVLQAGAYAKGGEIFVLDMGEPVKIADLARNLILLSGHKPNEDIMIQYTGLRPGEKLYEELLMEEEGLQDTANKMIHIGKPIEIDEEIFMKQLEDLREYVEKEPEDIREKVKEIVSTYRPE